MCLTLHERSIDCVSPSIVSLDPDDSCHSRDRASFHLLPLFMSKLLFVVKTSNAKVSRPNDLDIRPLRADLVWEECTPIRTTTQPHHELRNSDQWHFTAKECQRLLSRLRDKQKVIHVSLPSIHSFKHDPKSKPRRSSRKTITKTSGRQRSSAKSRSVN